ncbi:MAG: hypothetical protein MZV63_70880 [Marinilabiliales bacterium]|nr:hypothetical protein [Marinilabiliales bacterium]
MGQRPLRKPGGTPGAHYSSPALLPTTALVVRAGYENQAPFGKMLYSNSLPYPRGYNETICISEKLLLPLCRLHHAPALS